MLEPSQSRTGVDPHTTSTTVSTSALPTPSLPPTRVPLFDPASIDQLLDSPLGLGRNTPDSAFLATPLFDDDGLDDVPALEYSSLFPEVAHPITVAQSLAPTQAGHHVTNLLSTPFAFPSLDLDLGIHTPANLPLPPVPESDFTHTSAPRTTQKRTGDLTPLDAPIEPRTYLVPSVTGRKRRTTAVERELLKRGRAASAIVEDVVDQEIPVDLIEATERKRLQNTLSARKSRQRKAAKLEDLETRSEMLLRENKSLKSRVAELESLLRGIGLQL